ncbi:MAG: Hsp20 family protein [Alphaproteobacteria bacterium]|nr:Hsp20 family protein [Alphaproteobacteria bacterium]
MRGFDFSPLYRSTVGFDRLANLLESVAQVDAGTNSYPPYNIEQLADNDYRITMAVAGFGESDLSIEVKEGVLTVTGRRVAEEQKGQFLYQGIAGRAFERRFQLADHMEVRGARLEHGLLHIEIVRVVPEEKRARKISISATSPSQAKVVEAKVASAA